MNGDSPRSEHDSQTLQASMLKSDDIQRIKILRERARILAIQEEPEASPADDEFYVVQFVVGGQSYAIDEPLVREVSTCKHLTRIPCTPKFIAGVVNIRSEIIPVLETRVLLNLPSGWPDNRKLIVMQSGDTKLAILADDVVGVSTLSLIRLQPPLSTMSAEQSRYVRGIADGPVIVINGMSLLNDPGIVVDENVD